MSIDFDDRRMDGSTDGEQLLEAAQGSLAAVLKVEKIKEPINIGLLLVDDAQIREMNRNFRKIDAETDVLSFPSIDYDIRTSTPEQRAADTDVATGELLLGDIVLSVDMAKRQAHEFGHSFQREFCFLMVHGILHLLGFDHIEQEERAIMRVEEEQVLASLSLARDKGPETQKKEGGGESMSMIIDTKMLAEVAFAALEQAYAPYSGYRVGAALLCKDGKIYTGCNIENGSYGLSVCAERVAMQKAISEGAEDFSAVFVAGEGEEAPWPCGACRQVLHEFAPDLVIYTQHTGGKIHMRTLPVLMPKAFTMPVYEQEDDEDGDTSCEEIARILHTGNEDEE